VLSTGQIHRLWISLIVQKEVRLGRPERQWVLKRGGKGCKPKIKREKGAEH